MINYPQAFRSLRLLSFFVIAAIVLVAIFDCISGLLGIGQVVNPNRTFNLDHGKVMSLWLGIQVFAVFFRFMIFFVSGILFLVWLNRANKNLLALQPQHVEFSSGWAVGWWFVPFAALVKPFQVVREVWWESDPNRGANPQFLSASLHSAPAYMGFWWAAWLMTNIIENIAFRLIDFESTATVALTGMIFIASAATSFISACLAIYLVYDITHRQDERFRRLYPVQPGYTPPPYLGKYGEI